MNSKKEKRECVVHEIYYYHEMHKVLKMEVGGAERQTPYRDRLGTLRFQTNRTYTAQLCNTLSIVDMPATIDMCMAHWICTCSLEPRESSPSEEALLGV